MEIKIKAVGKDIILDNELVIKVASGYEADGLSLDDFKDGYVSPNNNRSPISVEVDAENLEIHYFFDENLTTNDVTPFDSALDEWIEGIKFPNQLEYISENIFIPSSKMRLKTITCGSRHLSDTAPFIIPDSGPQWSQTIDFLLPGATAETNLPNDYDTKIKFWVPASVLEELQTANPEVSLGNLSEYKEQA